jgi:hypothetical protein
MPTDAKPTMLAKAKPLSRDPYISVRRAYQVNLETAAAAKPVRPPPLVPVRREPPQTTIIASNP